MDKIDKLRKQINDLDDKIMFLLNQRFELSHQIGVAKSSSNMQILDNSREKEVLNKTSQFSRSPHLNAIYKAIIEESKNVQRK